MGNVPVRQSLRSGCLIHNGTYLTLSVAVMLNYAGEYCEYGEYCDACQAAVTVIRSSDAAFKSCLW